MSGTSQRLLILLIAGLAVAPALAADGKISQVVGANGDLLTLSSGTYAGLFPEGTAASPDAAVLALDLEIAGVSERFLVPTTDSIWPEQSATLLYDAGASVTYLLWSAPFNGIHPMLYLTSFDGQAWGQVFEIMGTIFSPKLDLRLVVTRDSLTAPDAPSIERTVIHVGWSEVRALGVEKKYTALVLENGEYVGRNPSLGLGSLLASGGPAPDGLVSGSMVFQLGDQDGSLVAGFVCRDTGRLHSLQIEVLPMALSMLAAKVEAAALAWDPQTGRSLMDTLEEALAEHGKAFHEVMLALISEDVRRMIAQWQAESSGDLQSLAQKFGPRIIHIGMKVGSNGLESPDAMGILTIGPDTADAITPRHDLKISNLGDWSWPEGVGEESSLFLSSDGGDALVAWQDPEEGLVIYQETQSDGSWSEARRLMLSEEFSLEAALAALADHVRGR